MEATRLVDIFGTSYFHMALTKDLRYLFDTAYEALNASTVKGNYYRPELNNAIEKFRAAGKIVIDLAGAHFSHDTEPLIRDAALRYGVCFINTEDKNMNALLEENRKRNQQDYVLTPIPLPVRREDLDMDFLRNIRDSSKGVVWTVNHKNVQMSYSLLALIILGFPEIDVDFGDGHYHRFFEYIFKNAGVSHMYQESRYVYTIVDSLCYADVTVTVNKQGNEERTVTVVGDGVLNVPYFVRKYHALPAAFGTETLVAVQPWLSFASKCQKDILNQLQPSKSILDYFPRKEV